MNEVDGVNEVNVLYPLLKIRVKNIKKYIYINFVNFIN
jgi:hypothetical protein